MDLDEQIIAVLQDDIPICEQPYKLLANQMGITEAEFLLRMIKLKESGQLRKMGAVLKHRAIGFTANALCAWVIPPERLGEVGQRFAQEAQVTHCYARKSQADWPYNLYTMIHAVSEEDCNQMAERLAAKVNVTTYILLFSVHEWKKSSMRYV